MNTQKYVSTLKIFPTLLGLASMSVLTSLPSVASQSSLLSNSSTQLIAEAQAPKELSPAALKVLCKNFPLNSRCTGAATETSEDASATDSAPADTTVSAEEESADSPAMSDVPGGEVDAAAEPTDTAEGGAEQPTETPTASDAPADDAMGATDETDAAAEGGAEQPTDDPSASDAPADDAMGATDETDAAAEGGAEQPTDDPSASDAPADDAMGATDETDATAEGGAEQPADDPSAGDATTPDATAPTMTAPTVAPPTVTPPTVTPPVSGPEGGEGGAAQPADDTGATPTAPIEETSPEGAMPSETEQPSSSTPETTPSADALKPEADSASGEQSSISEGELKQFATAIPQLSSLEKTTKGEISQVIGQSGLTQDKFNSLYNGQQASSPAVDATDAEKQSFEQAMTKIQAIEKKGQAEQEKVIRSQGLEPQRFSQILAAVRQDQSLRTKVQQMLQTN
ncbi:DUF4168 domain-containing protein [Acaryochloris sp. 'Moss Beach']|uniref:DUF4168 domain-containing protein n=1 Tax=Acaryochloris sp. 'Moss Beach' TaxID=2740837 RepID=UPI001F2D7351|nr:DUF4168 domain-containing protein [Acaryochloris sp. 'Moss Beach']UJB69933.1 DUF4168 domain-containing protein [Acaryochloris sp. 'Moss Beach']